MDENSENSDFRALMQRVRAGSQDAAWQLVDRYGRDVQRFVRRSLHRQLRPKFDSLDFVQIVWGSFFRCPERFSEMERPEQLVAFLATLAKFKVLTEVRRRLQSAKYDVNRENAFDDYTAHQTVDLLRRVNTPSAVAMARERWERMISKENCKVREIVDLRLQGTSFVEIAGKLSIHERTARKAIDRLFAESLD